MICFVLMRCGRRCLSFVVMCDMFVVVCFVFVVCLCWWLLLCMCYSVSLRLCYFGLSLLRLLCCVGVVVGVVVVWFIFCACW